MQSAPKQVKSKQTNTHLGKTFHAFSIKIYFFYRVALTAAHCLLSSTLQDAKRAGEYHKFRVYSGMFQKKNQTRKDTP